MATVLTFHMGKPRLSLLKALCSSLGIHLIEVDVDSERIPIGFLTGLADPMKMAAGAFGLLKEPPPIDEEMILMSGFSRTLFNTFLEEMKEISFQIDLKAIETASNQLWNGRMLQAELKRERAAMKHG